MYGYALSNVFDWLEFICLCTSSFCFFRFFRLFRHLISATSKETDDIGSILLSAYTKIVFQVVLMLVNIINFSLVGI